MLGSAEFLILFIILLLVAAVIVVAVRTSRRVTGGSGSGEPSALETLKQRYARGDISEEEYRRMRQTLEE